MYYDLQIAYMQMLFGTLMCIAAPFIDDNNAYINICLVVIVICAYLTIGNYFEQYIANIKREENKKKQEEYDIKREEYKKNMTELNFIN